MKRLFFLSLTLVLLSCSNEENVILSRESDKNVQAAYPDINIDTPYNFDPVDGGGMPNNYSFIIRNSTNFIFKFAAYSGLANYDGANDLKYWGFDLTSTAPYTSSPNLIASGNEYGNYINYQYVSINPMTTESHISNYSTPIVYGTSVYDNNGNLITDKQFTPQIGVQVEHNFLVKNGKIYFIKFEVYDGKTPITESIVKSSFAPNYDANNLPPSGNWERMNVLDNYFQEELIYNKHTKEIFLPIANSLFKDKSTFSYQGTTYEVGFKTTSTNVEIYIEAI